MGFNAETGVWTPLSLEEFREGLSADFFPNVNEINLEKIAILPEDLDALSVALGNLTTASLHKINLGQASLEMDGVTSFRKFAEILKNKVVSVTTVEFQAIKIERNSDYEQSEALLNEINEKNWEKNLAESEEDMKYHPELWNKFKSPRNARLTVDDSAFLDEEYTEAEKPVEIPKNNDSDTAVNIGETQTPKDTNRPKESEERLKIIMDQYKENPRIPATAVKPKETSDKVKAHTGEHNKDPSRMGDIAPEDLAKLDNQDKDWISSDYTAADYRKEFSKAFEGRKHLAYQVASAITELSKQAPSRETPGVQPVSKAPPPNIGSLIKERNFTLEGLETLLNLLKTNKPQTRHKSRLSHFFPLNFLQRGRETKKQSHDISLLEQTLSDIENIRQKDKLSNQIKLKQTLTCLKDAYKKARDPLVKNYLLGCTEASLHAKKPHKPRPKN